MSGAGKESSFRFYYELGAARWNSLPGTAVESREIVHIAGGDLYSGDQASEDNVVSLNSSGKLAAYKVLHFATHGLVVSSEPEMSRLCVIVEKREKRRVI
jgi:CHAT domain-containing protein